MCGDNWEKFKATVDVWLLPNDYGGCLATVIALNLEHDLYC